MAPLPKRKYSQARQGKRRSHLHLKLPAVERCPQCHSIKISHYVCPTCGNYNGKSVIEVKSSKKKA